MNVCIGKTEGGRRKTRRCYLGPESYIYVSHLHSREGLVFKGLADEGRVLGYLDVIIGYIEDLAEAEIEIVNAGFQIAKLQELTLKLKSITSRMLEAANRLESRIKQLEDHLRSSQT